MPHFNRHSAQLLKRAIDSGIDSPAELANLMGQTSVESAGFTRLHENLQYRSAERAMDKVGQLRERHSLEEVAAALATRDPETIGNLFYDNRKDLGNDTPGDGWRFHGRGVIHLTGRSSYEKYGRLVGKDLVNEPDLAAAPDVAADVAIAYWQERLAGVDRTDSDAVTRKVNGGLNGYADRVAATRQWAAVITPELIDGIRGGSIGADDLIAMAPSRVDHAQPTAVLRLGARGDDVRELQTQLHDLGYALRPDGEFGSATRDAVMKFQRNHGLPSDGIAGPLTLSSADASHRNLRQMPGSFVNEELMDRSSNVTRNDSIHEMFESLCRAADDRDYDALCAVGRRYGETPDAQDWVRQGQQQNQQKQNDALAAQTLRPPAQEQPQAPQPAAPAMSR